VPPGSLRWAPSAAAREGAWTGVPKHPPEGVPEGARGGAGGGTGASVEQGADGSVGGGAETSVEQRVGGCVQGVKGARAQAPARSVIGAVGSAGKRQK
jgi:hypothetical protein